MRVSFADNSPFPEDLRKLPAYIEDKARGIKTALRLTPSIFAVIGAQDSVLEASLLVAYVFILYGALASSTFSAIVSSVGVAVIWSSHMAIAKPFLTLQMDTKLIETNLLFALTYAFRDSSPSLWVWAMRLLLARVMIACGAAKLSGGDTSWADLSKPAMQWHYFTQPLPNALSQYMHYLPVSVHSLEVVGTYLFECAIPLAYVSSDHRTRVVAFLLTILFNATIGATGNYGHLHLLMMAMSVPVLAATGSCDSGYESPSDLMGILTLPMTCPQPISLWYLPVRFTLGLAGWALLAAYCVIAVVPFSQTFSGLVTVSASIPGWSTLRQTYDWLNRLHIIGYYSKFTHMTKFRWELQLEGTVDNGRTWIPFGYIAKPGGDAASLDETPRTLLPGYRPTLDWRQWFVPLAAARVFRKGDTLKSLPVEAWYHSFEEKVLQGAPDVLALIRVPPQLDIAAQSGTLQAVRTVICDYRFTDSALQLELQQHRARQAAVEEAVKDGARQQSGAEVSDPSARPASRASMGQEDGGDPASPSSHAGSPTGSKDLRHRGKGKERAASQTGIGSSEGAQLAFIPEPFVPSRPPLQPQGCENEMVPEYYLRGVPWECGSVWSRRFVCV
jgi:hypothetical protein